MPYPDGGAVDVFVLEGNEYTVTDFEDALGWL